MGDQNIKLGSGALYIGDEPFCEVNEVEEFEPDDIDYVKFMIGIVKHPATFTGTCTLFNMTTYLRAIMPNNWLRLHGYPMRRKVRLKRYGKKN
jgi:hypothetical protein